MRALFFTLPLLALLTIGILGCESEPAPEDNPDFNEAVFDDPGKAVMPSMPGDSTAPPNEEAPKE